MERPTSSVKSWFTCTRCWTATLESRNLIRKNKSNRSSVHPLREVIARLQCRRNLVGVHGDVLRQVLRILPLEELDAILRVRLTPEVAIRRSFLVLGLTERECHGDRARPAIELDFHDVCDVGRCEVRLLGAIRLHEEG